MKYAQVGKDIGKKDAVYCNYNSEQIVPGPFFRGEIEEEDKKDSPSYRRHKGDVLKPQRPEIQITPSTYQTDEQDPKDINYGTIKEAQESELVNLLSGDKYKHY